MVKSSSQGFKFSNDEKLKGSRNLTPGPGDYNLDSKIGKGSNKFSMGMKTNSKIFLPVDNPGPGAYNINDVTRPNTKSFKIRTNSSSTLSRSYYKNALSGSGPGPGQYSPEKKINNPKWTMGSKSESTGLYGRLIKIHEGKPAPCDYNLNKTSNAPKVKNNFNYILQLFDYLIYFSLQ